jgi:hypothetical protein
MRPITVTVGPLVAASANNIALTQTPASAVTLNGSLVVAGVAILDTPRRVLITTTGNESSKTFTIVGTNWSGSSISEVMTGPNATTGASVLDYATVTSITISATAANALTVGTNGVAASPWVNLDPWSNSYIAIQCTVSGTVNYTVQQTLDDPNSPTSPVAVASMTWVSSSDPAVVAATTTQQTNYAFTPIWSRVLLNSGTGTVTAKYVQSGVVNL